MKFSLSLVLLVITSMVRAQDLSTSSNWRMWPDTNAAWVDDPLYLPDQVVLTNMPINAPTGIECSSVPETHCVLSAAI